MSWGIVATVDEPPALVAAFAGWHIAQGAAEVHLYFDRPAPEATVLVAHLPNVQTITCDAAYWATHHDGFRGPRQTNRQMANARHARTRSAADWLFHIDADEFIRDGAALTTALDALPDTAQVFRLNVAERVHPLGEPQTHLFDGTFRRRDYRFDRWGDEVYGRWAKFLIYGLTGQAAGKVGLKRAAPANPGIHYAETADRAHLPDDGEAPDMLLHFDGLTPHHYLAKMLRRVDLKHFMGKDNPDGPQRRQQIRFLMNNAEKPAPIRSFLDGVKGIGPAQVAALEAKHLYLPDRFDPRAAIASQGLDLDLTPDAFDAALADHLPEVFAAFPTALFK